MPDYDAKPLLVPIFGTFVIALAVFALSAFASVVIFFGSSAAIVTFGH